MFGLYYGTALFSQPGVKKGLVDLWSLTAKIIYIICDPTPSRSDCDDLRVYVQRAHALFVETFYVDRENAFCLTPTTHAMLHLPQMLKECGPLVNVSQFLVERLVGEVGARVKSRLHPEANLFHKNHTLFSFRMLRGGLEDSSLVQKQAYSDPTNTLTGESWGVGKGGFVVGGAARNAEVCKYFSAEFGVDHTDVVVLRMKKHKKASCANGSQKTVIECQSDFRHREKKATYTARQRFCIAARFRCDGSDISNSTSESSADGDIFNFGVYYGYVKEIWEDISVSDKSTGTSKDYTRILSQIDWQYGLSRDKRTDSVFTFLRHAGHIRSVANKKRTLEDIGCVERLIEFMDVGNRRYYLDPLEKAMKRNGKLKGFV